jgi:hypothetical protein
MKKSFLLSLIFVLLGSLSCQMLAPPLKAETGSLDLTIRYTGHWYRETFDYQPDSQNIRHIAFVLPSEVPFEEDAGWVFTSLDFTSSPAPLKLREEEDIYKPMLEYLHDVPQGHAVLELPPGIYRLAVAFIAAELPPPDDDAILYAGVTGGGASNEFQEIVIEAGKTLALEVELTDENGWGYLGRLVNR